MLTPRLSIPTQKLLGSNGLPEVNVYNGDEFTRLILSVPGRPPQIFMVDPSVGVVYQDLEPFRLAPEDCLNPLRVCRAKQLTADANRLFLVDDHRLLVLHHDWSTTHRLSYLEDPQFLKNQQREALNVSQVWGTLNRHQTWEPSSESPIEALSSPWALAGYTWPSTSSEHLDLLFVLDAGNARVLVFNASLPLLNPVGSCWVEEAGLLTSLAVVPVEPTSLRVVVGDSQANCLHLLEFGRAAAGSTYFPHPPSTGWSLNYRGQQPLESPLKLGSLGSFLVVLTSKGLLQIWESFSQNPLLRLAGYLMSSQTEQDIWNFSVDTNGTLYGVTPAVDSRGAAIPNSYALTTFTLPQHLNLTETVDDMPVSVEELASPWGELVSGRRALFGSAHTTFRPDV